MGGDRNAVLVVEDDAAIARVVCALLGARGLEAVAVASGEDAVQALAERPFDVVLSDVRLPGMDGLAVLDHVSATYPEVPVVLVTAHGSVALAVDAMKRGAVDFVQKPFERDELAYVIDKALERSRRARSAPPSSPTPPAGGILGDAPAIRELLASLKRVAATSATVLVRGETGTGKELVAHAIHASSPRAAEAFVRVHCAALPETLLESELFGHERGAFTGATQRKPGRFELAHRGTLFLDEIGDISPAVQVKLLRVLQEREFERVGGTQPVRVDVRIVAATHRDLEAMVAAGTFREDLFYRLAVVPLVVPPLRERPGDVVQLARHFAASSGSAVGRPGVTLADDALALLAAEPWPGNVRQLQNFVERLVVLSDGPRVHASDVERELAHARRSAANPPRLLPSAASTAPVDLDGKRRDAEKAALVQALDRARNNRTQAARILGVSRRTVYNMLRAHGLD